VKSTLKFIGIYIALSLVAAAYWLMPPAAIHPKSWLGWFAFFALVLPATLAVEVFGDLLFRRNPLSRAVERHTVHERFSWRRVGYFLLLALAVSAAIALSFHWLTAVPMNSWLLQVRRGQQLHAKTPQQTSTFQSRVVEHRSSKKANSMHHEPSPNPSIEGTSTSKLRLLAAAPHVKR